ncbi:MAG: hypothetical protein V7672_00700 [Brevundimonas sp.]|uniref:hypothetical protein n=1 Tax=Brevundimonas sp. TaxID=1871086 RepID=UPI003002F74F
MEFALAAASAIAAASATVAATVVAAGPLAVAAFNAVNLAAAGIAASALLSGLLPNVPGSSGNPLEWVADMEAPLSVAYGANVASAGRLDYASDGYGPDNQYTSLVSTLSVGPIKGFNQYRSNDVVTTFGANDVATSGPHAGKMWLQRKVGTQPQTALSSPSGLNGSATIPDWGSAYKQSGRAVCMLTLQENSKGSEFRGGEEKQLHIFDGVFGWDPRLDSTWPGGSGSCRLDDPSTWVWIEEGCIAGLNWSIGRWAGANSSGPAGYGAPYASKQVAGIGSSLDGIDVDAFIAGANIADANGWKVRAYPDTGMDESLVLDMLLQSSGCVRNRVAGKISCVSRAAVHPSVVTITEADMAGPVELQLGVKRKERRNSAIASFWSAENDYEVVPIEEVSDPAWVTEDRGKKRLTGLRFNYVPDKDQAAVLTYLTLANLREPARGVIPCKPHMRQVRPGHRFTITVAHYALSGVKVLCTKREFDPMTGAVRLHFVAETDAKYTDAFTRTGVVPDQPDGPTDPGDTVDPPTVASISVSGDEVTINWTNGVARFFRTLIFYGTTSSFADAIAGPSKGGLAGEAQTAKFKPGPGTWYFWLVTKSMPFEDYSDAVALGSVTVTVEIDTGNLDDLDILRRTGGGLFSGDLTATEGADWTDNLLNRPTELTDGRIGTALAADGTLTAGARTGSGLMLRSAGSVEFTGAANANYITATSELTDDANLGGTAAWAGTSGRPTNLASLVGTEPILNTSITIGADGALTGAGGGQVTIGGLGYTGALNANYITNTNELTDGANLGQTAAWASVSSRPANLASLSGSEPILNSDVTLSGLGAGELAVLDAVDLDTHVTDGTTYKRFSATEQSKLSGVEAGAEVNPADLAALDATAASDLAAAKAGVDSLGDLATLDTVGAAQIDAGAIGPTALADNAVDLASAKVTGKSLANVDSTAASKLAGIETGAQVNPASLADLDATAASDLASAKSATDGLGALATKSEVDTDDIVANSVISVEPHTFAYTVTTEDATSAGVSVLVMEFDVTTAGEPLLIDVQMMAKFWHPTAGDFSFTLRFLEEGVGTVRDDIVIEGINGDQYHGYLPVRFTATPSAGTHTYQVRAWASTNTGFSIRQFSDLSAIVTHLKATTIA